MANLLVRLKAWTAARTGNERKGAALAVLMTSLFLLVGTFNTLGSLFLVGAAYVVVKDRQIVGRIKVGGWDIRDGGLFVGLSLLCFLMASGGHAGLLL